MESAEPPLVKSRYDYGPAWLLFVAGATVEEASSATNIPFPILKDYCFRKGWVKKRREAQDYAKRCLKESLQKRIEEHRIAHQHFILDTLEETQRKLSDADIVLKKKKDEDLGDNELTLQQTLSLTKEHDELARRTLGLDNEEKQDPMAFGFAMLKAMRSGQITQENTPSAIIPLLDNSDANAGILRPFNGHTNGQPIVDIEGKSEESSNGATQSPIEPTYEEMGFKPLPSKIAFQTPTPKTFVNEDEPGEPSV